MRTERPKRNTSRTLVLGVSPNSTRRGSATDSEESLFSWDFLLSLYSTYPNSSDNLRLNSRLLQIDRNQVVSEAYPVSNSCNLRKYNKKADRGHPKAGPISSETEASFLAWPSVSGLEPSPSFQHHPVCTLLFSHPLLVADKFPNSIFFPQGNSSFSRYIFFNP